MLTRQWLVRARERRLQAAGLMVPAPYSRWTAARPGDGAPPPQLYDLWTQPSRKSAWPDIVVRRTLLPGCTALTPRQPLSVGPIRPQMSKDAPAPTMPRPTLVDRLFRLPPVPVLPVVQAPPAVGHAAMPAGPVRVSVLLVLPQQSRDADAVGDVLLATMDTTIDSRGDFAPPSPRADLNV